MKTSFHSDLPSTIQLLTLPSGSFHLNNALKTQQVLQPDQRICPQSKLSLQMSPSVWNVKISETVSVHFFSLSAIIQVPAPAKHHSHIFQRSWGFISRPQTRPDFCSVPVLFHAVLLWLCREASMEQICSIRPEGIARALPTPTSDCNTIPFSSQEGTSDPSEGEWHYSRCDLESALTYKTANL